MNAHVDPAKFVAKKAILPLSCPPRGLSRLESAAYICVSASKFDEMVKDGRMPKPRPIDARNVWDRMELDAYFTNLPHTEENDPWANIE